MSPNVQKAALTALRGFFAFAVRQKLIAVDPTATVKRAAIPKTDGFATWEAEHLRAFERTWSLDSPERLAFALDAGRWPGAAT